MRKLLIPGGNGQVGSYVVRYADQFDFEPHPYDIGTIDVTDAVSVGRVFEKVQPDVVINCAAYTAVDKAEEEKQTAAKVNADSSGYIAACCAPDIPFLHISTDYVFSGDSHRPYTEDDPPNPINVYGKTKLNGEKLALEAHLRTAILRTAWVYSSTHNSFLKTMIRLGRERGVLSVVNDQRGTPTHAEDIALALLEMARQIVAAPDRQEYYGVFHFTGKGETTWHGFAETIFDELRVATGVEVELSAISTAEFPTPATRAAYSVLECARINSVFGIKPLPWQNRVRQAVRDYLAVEGEAA